MAAYALSCRICRVLLLQMYAHREIHKLHAEDVQQYKSTDIATRQVCMRNMHT